MCGICQTAWEIFDEAWGIENSEECRAFVVKAYGSDTASMRELEELLRAHDIAGGFLGDPAQRPKPTPCAGSGDDRRSRRTLMLAAKDR